MGDDEKPEGLMVKNLHRSEDKCTTYRIL